MPDPNVMLSNVTPQIVTPKVWIESVTFSDNTVLRFQPNDIVVVVGSNNSGKSAALRGIHGKSSDAGHQNPVILNLTLGREGSQNDLISWLEKTTKKSINGNYESLGQTVHHSTARAHWSQPVLGALTRFFSHLLTAEERLQVSNPIGAISLLDQAPIHPIHFLQNDEKMEKQLSDRFHKAFGMDLIVYRNGGSQVPLLCGVRPPLIGNEDRLSSTYQAKLASLPPIKTQGDGIRSFVGVLLYTSVGYENIILIDEPEAFLHPPQARQLGRMLVEDKPANRQIFMATHSGDLLRGVLDGNSQNVRIVRIKRNGAINHITQLDNTNIERLWSDSLLRYSNVLDGLFHEEVIAVESDSDARFYSAVMDALYENAPEDARKSDIMFINCGGKTRIPLVISALKELGVPVKAIPDFDIFNDEQPLASVVSAIGGDWAILRPDWWTVKNAIDSKKPELNSEEAIKEIDGILKGVSSTPFPPSAKKAIEKILRRSSPWSIAKEIGKSYVPPGNPTQTCGRLLEALNNLGIFVVEIGEVEGFCRDINEHGPRWVNEVLKLDLKNDVKLQSAREFVSRIIA